MVSFRTKIYKHSAYFKLSAHENTSSTGSCACNHSNISYKPNIGIVIKMLHENIAFLLNHPTHDKQKSNKIVTFS